ncbi:MAG: endo-1,4-beta-xylanase [Lachnospiraceae bacterium]|nr:endo-1,4-beta-xylanase [Lachnospiraceae bacterium]
MRKKTGKTLLARVLVLVLTVGLLASGQSTSKTEAAKKLKLSAKKILVKKGKSKKITLKNAKKLKVKKVKWKIKSKKIASIKIKKGTKYALHAVRVKGKKKGKTVLTCKVTKKNKRTVTLKCKVTVTKSATPTVKPTKAASIKPVNTPANTASPTPSGTDSENQSPESKLPDSIKEAYSGIFPYMGNCLSYSHWDSKVGKQMQDAATMEFVTKHFNSFTLENEMKPDSMFKSAGNWWAPTGGATLTKEEALTRGYVIPENYTESTVPELNFDTIDKVLGIAKQYNLKMRAHVLMWHQQTPAWFFLTGYQASGSKVSTDIMDARLEFYVRSVMKHVLEKEKELAGSAGSIVYAWDVTNEYIHRTNAPSATSWMDIYGDMGLRPSYVKHAYEFAYDVLKEYQIQEDVVLFYNDYDTYFSVEDIVSLVNFINEDEEANICGGIGMQSHLDIDRPTLEQYEAALDAFLNTGLEVQITELDMTINFDDKDSYNYKNEGQTNEDQAEFCEDLMKLIIRKHRERNQNINPKGITGVTVWGLSDSVSWRGALNSGGNMHPTLFGSGISDPKPSYYAFLRASQS